MQLRYNVSLTLAHCIMEPASVCGFFFWFFFNLFLFCFVGGTDQTKKRKDRSIVELMCCLKGLEIVARAFG